MSRRKTDPSVVEVDPLESAIENALVPDEFIRYNSSWSFVADLETVLEQIDTIAVQAPLRAVDLLETFIAGCYEKAEEIDDSSGNFGMFVENLFCSWVEARQNADLAPRETVDMLLAWIDDDPYGFTYQLERSVSKVLNVKGLNEFARSIRLRLEATNIKDHQHRQWRDALKNIYAAKHDLESYILICAETELLPVDCEILAGLCLSRRQPKEALEWVEKGVKIENDGQLFRGSSYKLDDMRRDILAKLGRSGEALEDAWQKFSGHPGEYSYQELMKYIPKRKQIDWNARILKIIKTADLAPAIKLLLKLKEENILVGRLRETSDSSLEALSHYTTKPAAEKLSKSYPDVAAKLHRSLGMRIVNAKKSKYYDAALSHFEQAQQCYEIADLESAWLDTVEAVRAAHYRKYSFMPGFEEIVAGKGPSTCPSFLERAKERWQK